MKRGMLLLGVLAAVGCSGGSADKAESASAMLLPPGPVPVPLPPPATPPWSVYGTDTPPVAAPCGPSSISDGMQIIADVCNETSSATGCHALGLSPTCVSYERELFTGVTLGGSVGRGKYYNGYGGRGEAMGEAGLCLLQALKDAPPLSTSLDLGLGVKASQRIGFLSFDPAARQVKGYRQLHVELPLLGGADLRAQIFTATLVDWMHPYDDHVQHRLGSYIVQDGWALDLTMDRSDESMNLTLASIPIPTPYGPVSVQPKFTYGASEPVITTPLSGTTQTRSTTFFGVSHTPLLDDIYGRFAGASLLGTFPDGGGSTGNGWSSLVGLGTRGNSVAPWVGHDGDVRPDAQLDQPRSSDESNPELTVSGGAAISYSPLDILPSQLRSDPFDTTFTITVTPLLTANLNGQLQLSYGEAAVSPDVSTVSNEQLSFASGIGGNTVVSITVSLDLTIKFNTHVWGIGVIQLVDVHPAFTVPIPVKSDFQKGPTASVRMSQFASAGNDRWSYDQFTKLDGTPVDAAAARGFVQACLAQPPTTKTLPPATVTPGTMPSDWVDKWPCNICVGVPTSETDVNNNVTYPAFAQVVTPSTSPQGPSWGCTTGTIGCMDLCVYDSKTGTLTVQQQQISGSKFCDPIR